MERRRHVVYLTKNTEYHCRLKECVGVRDRRTGSWFRDHAAIRSQLLGAVTKQRKPSSPSVGTRLLFEGSVPIMTSTVDIIGRPDRSAIFSYTSLTWSGTID
jgi:hypothetical protein